MKNEDKERIHMNLNLQGKTAIVIASSQGLGKAIASQLVDVRCKRGDYES